MLAFLWHVHTIHIRYHRWVDRLFHANQTILIRVIVSQLIIPQIRFYCFEGKFQECVLCLQLT